MTPISEEPSRRAQPPLWAQVRGWAIALTSVAMLIGLLDTRSDILRGVLIVALVAGAVLPWALISLLIMLVCLMALIYWTRSPDRVVFVKTGGVMCLCTLSMALGMLGLNHLTGTPRLVGSVLYMGVGGAALMFMQVVIPKWQDRGFLRHPKPIARVDDAPDPV